MNKQKLISLLTPSVIAIALIAYAAYILTGIYPDVLFTAQDRNVFTSDSFFFCKSISQPFGLFQYLGAWLTQLFFHPTLGAGLLIAIWTAIVFAGIKALRLSGSWRWMMIVPAACLLASIVDVGYWIYCLVLPGYWFSQSVAFLFTLLLIWAANSTPRRFRIVWHLVIGFAAFPVMGWFSYLFTICLTLSNIRKESKPAWTDGLGIILSFIAPLVFRALIYEGMHQNDIYMAGFPYFKTFTDESIRPSIPFFILICTTMLLCVADIIPAIGGMKETAAPQSSAKKMLRQAMPHIFGIIVAAGSACYVWNCIFMDDNYIYEMQMTHATMDNDWQKVINVAVQAKHPSRTMVMLKNIALMNTGELGDRSFELSNDGAEINNPDSLNINIMHIASPVIYYYHGEINYGLRWCVEFGVAYGFSPYYLKMLVQCAEATGEKRLAHRYMTRLRNTMFYSDWHPKPISPITKELQRIIKDTLDNDDNSCERYIIKQFALMHYAKSPHMVEERLLYSMIIRNPQGFWSAFYDYMQTFKGDKLPTHYAEAYCLFMDQVPVEFPLKVNIPSEIMDNYRAFCADGERYASFGLTKEGVKEAMEEVWGGTYWWFNAFGRDSY